MNNLFKNLCYSPLEDEEKNPEAESCDFRYFRFPTIYLSKLRFAKPLLLTGTTFRGKAYFVGTTFSGKADFRGADFSGRADFWGTTFSGEAVFGWATFSEVAVFGLATFSGRADFYKAAFSGAAYFEGATFSEVANFISTTFSESAYFVRATFSGRTSFGWATFSGRADFKGETFKGVCDFINLTLDEKAEVVFEKTNLNQSSFLDTNLERIHFRDIDWHRKGRRIVLWDESPHEGEQPDYEKVAEIYRQLVLNYEAKRDFDTAEEFHIGEMEMRRKKKRKKAENKAAQAKSRGMGTLWRWWGTIREWINGYSIYKLLSNYGTSYVQGFLVLGVLLALFSGIFLFTGLKSSKEHKDSLHDINYKLCLHTSCQRTPWQQKVCDSAKAIVFTLSLLTFQKERLYEPANAWTQFWICIAVPLLAGQTALVLFAIRRRFKR